MIAVVSLLATLLISELKCVECGYGCLMGEEGCTLLSLDTIELFYSV